MPHALHVRRTLLVALLALAGGAAPGRAQADQGWVTSRMDAWFRQARRLAPGRWGVAIADQQGTAIWTQQPDVPLTPASTVKVLTTGFARSVVGGAARRPTRVLGTGTLDPVTGAWNGSWHLELNGDITLERMPGTGPQLVDLAAQLAARGIRRLYGPLVVESADGPADATYPAVWSPKHRGRLFAPLIGPLMLHENMVYVDVAPGPRAGAKARLVGASPSGVEALVTVQAMTRGGRRARLGLRPRGDGGWVLGGTIGASARVRRLTAVAPDPRRVLEAAWASALRDQGILWEPRGPVAAPPDTGRAAALAVVQSPPFDTVASEVNRRSLNPGAELLLQWAAGRGPEAPQRLTEHVREVTGHGDDVHLVDGSGLSYDDRMSPSAFIAYLAKYPQTPSGRNFPMLLPANGSGTLRRLASGFPGSGVVRAKTGTLGSVSTLVGYLGRPNGTLIVALMYNGPRPWAARQAQWRLFRLLGADGVVIPADSSGMDEDHLGGSEDSADAPLRPGPDRP